MQAFDVVIIGAGAAGLFCAGVAGQKGLRVLLVDHRDKVAEKIRISGGGRSNFTNREVTATNFVGANPHFCRSALARYSPQDFMALLTRHGVPFHEKHKGQMFCDRSAQDLIAVLLAECGAGGVDHRQNCPVHAIRAEADGYVLDTAQGPVASRAVVVATGGLSIPKIGASDFGYRIARQFGLPIIEPRPALVPLTFDSAAWQPFATLAGLSLPVQVRTGAGKRDTTRFLEDLLFTHRGLSGPAILQISSFWRAGQPIHLDLAPGQDLTAALREAKLHSRRLVANELAAWLPARLADTWVAQGPARGFDWQRPVNDSADKALNALAASLTDWQLVPNGSEGYAKAEVTAGGVGTQALSSQSMESTQPGLYFIGEVVDVTGWLGGYNFQWAWASAFACAQALAARFKPDSSLSRP